MISGLYFQQTPDHLRPKRKPDASSNRGVKGSNKLRTGVYAEASEAEHYFKRKVLPKIEAARKAGHIVRFMNGRWLINGAVLEV